ncbi:MAG: MFS transporter [Acidobacteria bacterium]|nr:MFS transporter [Acidobacteriota bacterium]
MTTQSPARQLQTRGGTGWKPVSPNLRWYIGVLLFLSTVINYIDRQTLSVLAPFIKQEYQWSNSDFALLIISFRVAYALGQTLAGRFLDRVGTRVGLTITVAFYSLAAMFTSLAVGLKSFCAFRFLVGFGESANWPGATKAVSEWFPRKESGWAVALFDSGSSIGAAVAPMLVLWVYHWSGSWRPAFLAAGALGLLWLPVFWLMYRRPEERLQVPQERPGSLPYRSLLGLPQTWGIILAKTLTDPVWFFITDWFAIYLVSKGYPLEQSLLAFWIPFVAADAGNFIGGGVSSYLISRGWSVGTARKTVVLVSGLGMAVLMASAFLNSFHWLIACFAVSTLSYAALSTMVLNLPADVFPSHSVASVSGMSGTGAGIGTIVATYLIGRVADARSFEPVLIVASLVPLLAVLAVLSLVRNNAAVEKGIVNSI